MPIVGRLDQYASMISVGEFDETTANSPSITGLGTYYALEFSENVGIATTISANVFAPYDPVYDEFAGVLYGPGQGRYMTQNSDKSVVVYNEINEIGLSPSYAIIPSTTTMNEGSSVTFTANTSNVNVGSGTTFFYSISGSVGIASTDFTNNSLSGSFIISGTDSFGVGSTTLTLSNDLFADNTETFSMNLRTGSISGPIVTTSQNITINDTSQGNLYSFTSFTFTNATAEGTLGPTLANLQSTYSAQSWASTTDYLNLFNSTRGYQRWTVPASGTYRITAAGAQGGAGKWGSYYGGLGAIMRSTITLVLGDYLIFVVGQRGGYVNDSGQGSSGGGGGTFVFKTNLSTPILIAGGGGGGGGNSSPVNGRPALTTNNGDTNSSGSVGGSSGAGGPAYSGGGGGSGLTGNGGTGVDTAAGGLNITTSGGTGGRGGSCSTSQTGTRNFGSLGQDQGGFGGGGGGEWCSQGSVGGGGGYSGGAGNNSSNGVGGGGGSYVNVSLATLIGTSNGTYNGTGSYTNIGYNGSTLLGTIFSNSMGYVTVEKI